MTTTELNLDFTERSVFALRSLYNRYGYTQYKMSKFEEYDLYAGTRIFSFPTRSLPSRTSAASSWP